MSTLSEKVRTALYGKMNVSAVTNLATGGVHHITAPESAALPFILFMRSAPGAVEWGFSSSQEIEDDLWMVKALADEDSSTSLSPQSLNEDILEAAETAIGQTLTLSGGTALWVRRFSDIPELTENVGDRLIYQNGFLLRVSSQ